jgi:hypothetical protein
MSSFELEGRNFVCLRHLGPAGPLPDPRVTSELLRKKILALLEQIRATDKTMDEARTAKIANIKRRSQRVPIMSAPSKLLGGLSTRWTSDEIHTIAKREVWRCRERIATRAANSGSDVPRNLIAAGVVGRVHRIRLTMT